MIGWNLVGWLLYMLPASYYRTELIEQNGGFDLWRLLLLSIWIGGFAGFVAFLANHLHARRSLLLGLIEPEEREWAWLSSGSGTAVAGVWRRAGAAAVALAAVVSTVHGLWFWIAGDEAFGGWPLLLTLGALPAAMATIVAAISMRWSLRSYVSTIESPRHQQASRWKFILLGHALPLTLFNTGVGMAVGVMRFLPQLTENQLVASGVVARHLAFTSLVINLVIAVLTRVKMRVDFLSPLVVAGASRPVRFRWGIWTMLVLPALVYGLVQAGLTLFGPDSLRVAVVLWLKFGTCLVVALGMSVWAGLTALSKITTAGLDGNNYVRLHRFLRRGGFT